MVRTVKVRLELDRDDYKRGLRDAANEARGFDGEVRSVGKDAHAMGVEVKSAGTEVQSMGREVDATAKKTASLGDEVEKAKRKTTGLGEETRKTKEHSTGLGDETDKTKEKTKGFGEESDKTRTKIVNLAKEITATKAALAALGTEFQHTGQVNVTELDRLSRSLRDLERAKASIGKLVPGEAARERPNRGLLDFALDEWVVKVAKGTQSGIARGVDTLPAPTGLIQWLAVGAVAAAPAIGAAINAGVLLGVGGGVLTAGIIAAAQDPRVSGAYAELGGYAVQGFKSASAPLIEPLLNGASKFEHAWTGMLPGIRSGMAQLGPVVDHIVDGVLGFIDKIGPGFGHAFQASLPILEQLGDELPRLGEATGSFFDSIAEGGPGAIAFFHDLMTATDVTIVSVGFLVGKLAELYEFSHTDKFGALLGNAGAMGFLDKLLGAGDKSKEASGGVKEFADALAKAREEAAQTSDLARQVGFAAEMAGLGARVAKVDFGVLSAAISDTGSTSDMLAGKMTDRLMGTMLGMSHATLGVQSSLLNMKDTLDSNGLAIDRHTGLVSMNTKAGISNREGVLGAIEANLRMYDAQINSGVGADVATAKYEQNTQALHDQLRQAGLTEEQVSDLIGEYGRVPSKVNTSIAMNGLTEAINGLNDLLRQILGLPSKKTITIEQITKRIDAGNVVPGTGGMRIQRWGGITEHAETGLLRDANVYSSVSSGARYAFAEPATQGEAFIPKSGDLERSRGIWNYVGANWLGMRPAGGGGSVTVHLTSSPIPLTLDGRKVAELVIEDGRNGGPINTYVRQVAAR